MCGKTESEAIAVAHSYGADDKCTYCGEHKPTEGLYIFVNEHFGEAFVSRYDGTDEDVYVPSLYNGAPVVGINSSAFQGNKTIKNVTLPATIKSIPDRAFYECSKLSSIVIPNGTIGAWAFWECGRVSEVVLGDGVTEIGEWAFAHCTALKTVIIPKSVTDIGNKAFDEQVENVVMETGVEYIGYYNFGYTNITYMGTKAQWDEIIIGDHYTWTVLWMGGAE